MKTKKKKCSTKLGGDYNEMSVSYKKNDIIIKILLSSSSSLPSFSLNWKMMLSMTYSIIDSFEKASGLNVNLNKSEIPGIHTLPEDICQLVTRYNCKISRWPRSYLGLPLFGKPKSVSFRAPLWKRLKKRLPSWNNQHISKGCKLILLQYSYILHILI